MVSHRNQPGKPKSAIWGDVDVETSTKSVNREHALSPGRRSTLHMANGLCGRCMLADLVPAAAVPMGRHHTQ